MAVRITTSNACFPQITLDFLTSPCEPSCTDQSVTLPLRENRNLDHALQTILITAMKITEKEPSLATSSKDSVMGAQNLAITPRGTKKRPHVVSAISKNKKHRTASSARPFEKKSCKGIVSVTHTASLPTVNTLIPHLFRLAAMPFAAPSQRLVATPSDTAPSTLDIDLLNKTHSNHVYAYITGQVFTHGNHNLCLISSDGCTPYCPDSPARYNTHIDRDCAILVGPGSSTTATIPFMNGGRIWFSIEKKLIFLLSPSPSGAVLVEPSVTNSDDPNYDTEWGYCEFSFTKKHLFASISYASFVSVPISLNLTTIDDREQSVLGFGSEGLAYICNGLNAQHRLDGASWNKLVVQSHGKFVRALSPNNALLMTGGKLFERYFDTYIDEVWSRCSREPLIIDTQSQYGTIQGRVCAKNRMHFKDHGSFGKPSTKDVFSCDTGPFAQTTGALVPLTARIAAGFNRSTLLKGGSHPDGQSTADFYKSRITNHYARLVHGANLDGKGFAFPFDDVKGGDVDQSGFVNGRPKAFRVAVG